MPLHAVKLTAEEIQSPADNKDAPVSVTPKPVTKLALVVPTLREADNIRAVLDRIRRSLDPLGFAYEILVVDDDSGDGIDSIVQEISRKIRVCGCWCERANAAWVAPCSMDGSTPTPKFWG